VLADEPTGNLDTKNSDAVLQMLLRSNRELGQTTLMITHNPEAAAVAGRILYMRDGQIVKEEVGSLDVKGLKTGYLAASSETGRSAQRPVLNSTEAQLFVADIQTSCDFYARKLGFTVAFVHGDPPFYGQVTRGRAQLNLRAVSEAVFAGDVRERESLLSASITVASSDEINQLFQSYQAAGVRFRQLLREEPWGARTFVVQDPDGNLVLFSGPAQ
jgi:energy-coupling factor transporter ATP-binding protein EcfA2